MDQLSLMTSLTRCLNCRFPVLLAPMAGASGFELATEVSLAGGFGFISAPHSSLDPKSLSQELDKARAKFPLLGAGERLPLGYGFLCWRLEDEKSKGNIKVVEECLSMLAEQVRCVWFAFGHELPEWVHLFDRLARSGSRECNCRVAVQVTSDEEAEELLRAAGGTIDILVAQGLEAGGHGAASGIPINALVPALLDLLMSTVSPPALVAAGGLVTGAHLAAMLTLGSDGIVCGTRFLATPEANYSSDQKTAILAARSQDTIRTSIFDILRGTTGWPAGIDGRALRNQSTADHLDGTSIGELKMKYEQALEDGDSSRLVTWCGSSVGSVKTIKPAQQVVREIVQEAIFALKRAGSLVQ